jgi:hypothetical protein
MFNKHIIEEVKIQERRHYMPLIIGALQENMVDLMITLKVLQKKKDKAEVEKEFEYEVHEMSNFSYKMSIFITALQEQDLPKKFVSQLLEELIREMEEVNNKIREIVARE